MFQKFPYVKQQDEKECGICCLLMIIRYYRGNYPLRELGALSHTTKRGTTAYHLLEASRQVGFEARGVKCSIEQLKKEDIVLPCIAHITTEHGGHYVVIYKISGRAIWIADPATGLKKIPHSLFENKWTGTLLLMVPKETIAFHKELNLSSFFFELILAHKKLLILATLLSFIITIFSIGTTFYLKLIMEFLSKHYSINILIVLALFFELLFIMKHLSIYFRQLVLSYLSQKIDLSLFLETFEKLLHLPYSFFRMKTTGDIISRIRDLTILKNAFLNIFMTLVVDSFLVITSLLLIVSISLSCGFEILLIIILYFTIFISFEPYFKRVLSSIKDYQSKFSSNLTETILGMESIRGLHLENEQQQNLEKNLIPLLDANFKLDRMENTRVLMLSLLKESAEVIILGTTAYFIYQKKIGITSLILISSILSYVLEPIEHFSKLGLVIREGTLSLRRLVDLFIDAEDAGTFHKLQLQKICCHGLSYQIGGHSLLSNLSFEVSRGEKILLVGDSGSGKSTLLKLLMKYDTISDGEILYNSHNINHYKNEAIKNNISYLSQDELLFTTTLYENVVMNRTYNETSLKEVLSMCEVDLIAKKHPLGYQMFIEEDGFNLSGGEKARIILARHLLHPRRFILIDEGFSHMDTSLERRILKRLFERYKNHTFIIVSHRLDNLDLFSRMISMKDGSIINDVSK